MALDSNSPASPSAVPAAAPPAVATAPPRTSGPNTLSEQYDVGDGATVAPAAQSAPATAPGVAAPVGNPAPPPGNEHALPERGAGGRFLPRYLSDMARDAGLTEEEIRGADPEVLGQSLRMGRLLAERNGSIERTMQDALDRGFDQTTPVRQDPANPPAPESDDFGLADEHFAALTGDGYTPEMRALAGAFRKLLAEHKSTRAELSQLRGTFQQQNQSQLQRDADAWFAQHPVYGTGGRSALPKGSPELIRRQALLNLAGQFRGALHEQMAQAHAILYPGRPAASHSQPQAGANGAAPPLPGQPSAEEWDAAGAARPTQRSGAAEGTGYEKAVASVTRAMQDQGGAAEEPGVSVDDFI